MSLIADNLKNVQDKISKSAQKAGVNAEEIELVVVTKTRTIEEIDDVLDCGINNIAENYVQEAQSKFAEIGNIVKWHMIGHLQTNKAKQAVEVFDLVQSVDSFDLAQELSKRALAAGKTLDVLVEVNISREEQKFGVKPEETLDFIEKLADLEGIVVMGLMGMAPLLDNPEDTRPYFRELRSLWEKLPEEQRVYLSMGMTCDFEQAILEGSNMVRIGTAIFGQRK
ncbi:MAG: YggS family pyridoxal phosphate-dependent enzyme [Armatimonadota bacterium]